MYPGVDDVVRNEIEAMREAASGNKSLSVLIETEGGYVETVERIVRVFRRHYEEVYFLIPSYAYSAGTVLVLSGDEIYMDYYSVLGPIDPQFRTEDGDILPGMGYLQKFNDLVGQINAVEKGEEEKVRAQLSYLLNRFDPAKLFHIEQSIQHSSELIEKWLQEHKFKNWKKTEGRGIKVTAKYKEERAKKIARKLGDVQHWHSHGRGISMADLEGDDIGLKVKNFEDDTNLYMDIRHYFGLFSDFVEKLGYKGATHTMNRLQRVV